jgi:3'(2'), 5'-bisphosphate nucleotidase
MYERELEVALAAADLAGRYLIEEYERFQAIPNAAASITTHADRQAQEIILGHILQNFPGDALCAEEATPALQKAAQEGPRQWIVDPIDGTRGFAMKNGEFSVMIGFVDRGVIGASVVAQPAAGRVTYARRGGGCWRQDAARGQSPGTPVQCHVSDVANLEQATLTQSRSRQPGVRGPLVEALNPGRIVESYSAGIKLALVARADADLYLNTYDAFHDWDICAGHLLVAEAGGQVTGIKGEELRYGLPGAWQKAGLLATNGKFHTEAVARIMGSAS